MCHKRHIGGHFGHILIINMILSHINNRIEHRGRIFKYACDNIFSQTSFFWKSSFFHVFDDNIFVVLCHFHVFWSDP